MEAKICPKTGRACEVTACDGTLCAGQSGFGAFKLYPPPAQGWQCPVCHVGVAPFQPVCPNCTRTIIYSQTASTLGGFNLPAEER